MHLHIDLELKTLDPTLLRLESNLFNRCLWILYVCVSYDSVFSMYPPRIRGPNIPCTCVSKYPLYYLLVYFRTMSQESYLCVSRGPCTQSCGSGFRSGSGRIPSFWSPGSGSLVYKQTPCKSTFLVIKYCLKYSFVNVILSLECQQMFKSEKKIAYKFCLLIKMVL